MTKVGGMKKGYHLSDIAKQHHREAALKAHAKLHYQVGEKNSRYGARYTDEEKENMRQIMLQYYKDHPEKRPIGSKNGMFGKKQTPEAVKKSINTRTGMHYHTEKHKQELREICLQHNPMNTPNARKKHSESLKGLLVANKNPNWRGGTSFEPYCIKFNKEFRERVRAFFNYQCIECGTFQNGIKLHVHHVNFNKGSCCEPDVPKLFIALCGSCHSKTMHNRTYWEDYFTNIITSYYNGKCYFTKEEMKLLQPIFYV